MSDEEPVLVSTGRCAERFHRRLAKTRLSTCGRLVPASGVEVMPRDEAEADGYEPCGICSSPERAERPEVATDGGEP